MNLMKRMGLIVKETFTSPFSDSYIAEIDDKEVILKRGGNYQDRDFQGLDLEDVHLEGANLRNVNLQNTNLINAHLEGADLSGARFSGAVLAGAHRVTLISGV